MASLREIAIGHHTSQGTFGPDYWNADTSLLFGAGFQPPTSTRCSPVTPNYTRAGKTSPPNSTWYHTEIRYKEWGCCLYFARVLLAPSFYKHNNLESSGRTHAHGMARLLPCGFIAQQFSVLASFSLTVLFIAKARPRVGGKVMTLSPCGPEGLQTCARLKVMTLSLYRDVFCC
jgi:hypothetical protein